MNETLTLGTGISKKNISSTSNNLQAPPAGGLQEYTGVWNTPQVVHLLKRTLFGFGKKSDYRTGHIKHMRGDRQL